MNTLKQAIEAALGVTGVHLEYPNDPAHGDFATNIAMNEFSKIVVELKKQQEDRKGRDVSRSENVRIFQGILRNGKLIKNPRELAEMYVEKLRAANIPHVATIEIAGPGFINFRMERTFFSSAVAQALHAGDEYGKGATYGGTKYIFEYTDPNPFKQFHIGHFMSNTIGEAFSRLAEWNGAEVKRVTYQGDVGMHVASAIWGMQQMQSEGASVETMEALGEAYARGATALKEDAAIKAEIQAINKHVYERSDDAINELYDRGRALSLAYFETIYQRLGSRFDYNFFESESAPIGKKLVEEHPDIFTKSDGAIVYEGEKHGLHTRVFINSEGLPTYEAKELGLARIKHDWYPYDVSVVITGNEINEYFKVLLAAMNEVYPELAVKTIHQSHGMLRLPSGKMSSRTGDVITAEALLDTTRDRALTVMQEPDEHIAEMIAVAGLKYAILRQSPGKDVVFDPEQALSFEGDSGPYIQYTYVRTKSILEKAADAGITASTDTFPEDSTDIERLLHRFPHVIEEAAEKYAPHTIVTYVTELASAFNTFYAGTKILDTDNPYAPYYLALTEAVGHTLKNGLFVLGIDVPERM